MVIVNTFEKLDCIRGLIDNLNSFQVMWKKGQNEGIYMKKFMASILMAGIALVPILGMTAEVPAPTPVERATKAAANADTIYQQAKAVLEKAQQDLDLKAANLAKAKEDLKIATAAGDKAKIKAAQDALREATLAAAEATRIVRQVTPQVERLKVITEKAKLAVTQAGAADPKVSEKAADDAEALAAKAVRISKSIEEILKPRGRPEFVQVTIPTTTTSTTQPSPTPVGERG